jgi:hypothetical protein
MFIIIGSFVIIGLAVYFSLSSKAKEKELLETVTNSYRGTDTERNLVLKLLKYGIPAENIFHDLYVEKSGGNFSQIDLVVLTEVGIIVFEVKDYSGWLFGKGNQDKWTQVLAYGKIKHRFYNPVMQNNGHITALKKQLPQFEELSFYSVIIFYGNCRLRDVSFIPQGTYLAYPERVIDVIKTIMKNNKPINYSNKSEIIRVLKEAVQKGENKEIQNKHIINVRDMLGKDRIFE